MCPYVFNHFPTKHLPKKVISQPRTKTFSRMSSRGSRLGARSMLSRDNSGFDLLHNLANTNIRGVGERFFGSGSSVMRRKRETKRWDVPKKIHKDHSFQSQWDFGLICVVFLVFRLGSILFPSFHVLHCLDWICAGDSSWQLEQSGFDASTCHGEKHLPFGDPGTHWLMLGMVWV